MAAELLLFRGDDRASALAAPANEGTGTVQVAVVARDEDDRAKKLALAHEGKAHSSGVFLASSEPRGKVAFLFPGQGRNASACCATSSMRFPSSTRCSPSGPGGRAPCIRPRPPRPRTRLRKRLRSPIRAWPSRRSAWPALRWPGSCDDMASSRTCSRDTATASSSRCVSRARCRRTSLLGLSELRGRRILEATASAHDPGTMAAVAADPATTAAHLAGLEGVVIANENSPEQSVISGPTRAVHDAVERLLAAGVAAQPIPVACAFHSPLVHAACDAFARDLAEVDVASPRLPVYSNTTASLYPAEPGAIRARLAEHIGKPVHFVREIEAMYADGARVFVEAGPGRVLTGLVGRILGKRPHAAIACDRPNENGVFAFLLALGQLAVRGVPVKAS
jgi:acyl transferase domain-containing protein